MDTIVKYMYIKINFFLSIKVSTKKFKMIICGLHSISSGQYWSRDMREPGTYGQVTQFILQK